MRVFDGVDDLLASVGEQLGPTDWVHVDQDRIDRFAEASDDRQWIHVDPGRAADGPFGTTIAHGFLTLSLLPYFLNELFRLDGIHLAINYGLDKVRLPAPVPVGSELRATTTVANASVIEGAVQVELSTVIEIDGVERPACVVDSVMRLVQDPMARTTVPALPESECS